MLDLGIISKHRAQIYGILALWIVPLHLWLDYGMDFTFGLSALQPLGYLIACGSVAVDAFLLISGVCLYWAYGHQKSVYDFWRRRFIRVFPAALIAYGLFWIAREGFSRGDWGRVLWQCTFLNPLVHDRDTGNWFITGVLVLYLLYPFFHHILCEKESLLERTRNLLIGIAVTYILCILFSMYAPEWFALTEIIVTRVPIFMLGTYLGPFVKEGCKLPKWTIAVVLGLLVLGFAGIILMDSTMWTWRIALLPGGIGVAFTLALIFDAIDSHGLSTGALSPLWRFLGWVGGFSLEVYCVHQVVRRTLTHFMHFETWASGWPALLLVYAVSIPLAWALRAFVVRYIQPALSGETDKAQGPAVTAEAEKAGESS